MNETLTVEVTAEDIANGFRGYPADCALALAFARALPGYRDYSVGFEYANVTDDDGRVVYHLSLDAERFVRAFDDGALVEPTTFVFRRFGSASVAY